jgi:hypothetical protein
MRIEYAGIGAPLEQFTVQKHLPITASLTEGEFIEKLHEVNSALLLVMDRTNTQLRTSVLSRIIVYN